MSGGIDVTKSNSCSERIIWYYWYFLKINWRFQSNICNICHNLTQKVLCFNDVAIVFVKRNDYRFHFWYMRKDEAINLLRNADFTEKRRTL